LDNVLGVIKYFLIVIIQVLCNVCGTYIYHYFQGLILLDPPSLFYLKNNVNCWSFVSG